MPSRRGNVHVEEHERGLLPARHLQRLQAVGGLVELELGDALQCSGDELADERVVVDHKNPARHRAHVMAAAIRLSVLSSID